MRMVSTSRVTKRAIATLLSVAVVSGLFAAVAAAQNAPPTGVVISELRVRGPAGGNDEFVELRNTSDASVDISGYALQGCASSSGNASNRAIVDDNTTLNPGQSFLFTNDNTTGGPYSGDVPGDQTYGTGIADFGPTNKSGARIVDDGEVVDQVGGPGSPCREGGGIISSTENVDASLERRVDGTQDTDDNSADFQQRTPSDPQNSSETEDESEVTPISQVQGEGQTSPFVEAPASSSSPGSAGETVTIEGVVTGIDDEVGQSRSGRIFENERGIFVQEEAVDQDEDPNTSEAIFVGFVREPKALFTPGGGQVVRVTGRVRELFGFTIIEEEIGQEPEVVGTAPQPDPVQIDEAQAEGQSSSDPDADEASGRDYYESLESMRVEFPTSTANSGGTNKFDELFLTPGSDPAAQRGGESGGERDRVFRESGDPVNEEAVPELFATDEDAGSGNPEDPGSVNNPRSTTAVRADLFDTANEVVGPFAFNFGNYKVMVQEGLEPIVNDEAGVVYPFQERPEEDGGLKSFEEGEDVRVVSYNINNFFDNVDDPETDDELDETTDRESEKRTRAVDAINDILKRPDVISLQEVENQAVLDRLANALGGYRGFLAEGRDERGIDNAFLVKVGGPDSIVTPSNFRQLGRDERTPASVPDEQECSDEEGFLFDRPPISVDIETEDGREFTVFGSHFASKGGPNERRQCREEQARFLREQVEEVEEGSRDGDETGGEGGEAIVAADLNAFEDEEPLRILEDGGLDNLWDEEQPELRYSFQFQGRLQTLDHVLVTEGLREDLQAFQYAHFNVDYYEREASTPGTPTTDGHKLSVHDPPIFTLGPAEGEPPPSERCNGQTATIVARGPGQTTDGTSGDDVIVGTDGPDVINGRGGDDTICGRGGDDRLLGEDGNDRLLGEDGNDRLIAGGGQDGLIGGEGDDSAEGGGGQDALAGNGGDDTLDGGGGRDALSGGDGKDTLRGGRGDDIVDGGEGTDLLKGGDGRDRLFGRDGDDRLEGGNGDDALDGGPGTDTCDGGSGNNTEVNCEDGDGVGNT